MYYRDTIQQPEIEGITFSIWGVNIKKRGRIVSIQFNVGGSVEKLREAITLFTIDEKYRPADYININYVSQNGNPMLISISDSGHIQLYANTAETVRGFFIRQCITFISAS